MNPTVPTTGGARLLELWLNTPWYFQVMNFFFLVLILGVVFVILLVIFKTIKIKWSPKKGEVQVEPVDNPSEELEASAPPDRVQENEDTDEYPSLLHHRVFNVLSSVQSSSVLGIDETTNKGAIGITFLRKCKFLIWEKSLRDFIEKIENNKGSLYELTTLFIKMENEYYKLAAETPVALPSGVIIPRIPKVYIDKYEKNNNLCSAAQLKNIEAILNSRYYKDWKIRAVACLDLICLIIETSFQITAWSIESLNGEIDKEIEKILNKKGN